MRTFDDSDMKIAGSKPSEAVNASERETDVVYEHHRDSGNLAKSRRLGASLADYIERFGNVNGDPSTGDIKIELHKRLLAIFAMVVGIESLLPDRVLIRASLNVFYDTLKKEKPQLYDAMSSSGAFTFYYLAYRKGSGSNREGIGSSFAMLCGNDGNQAFIDMGLAVFDEYYSYVEQLIGELNFI